MRHDFRWKPNKRRSPAQIAQFARMQAQKRGQENSPPEDPSLGTETNPASHLQSSPPRAHSSSASATRLPSEASVSRPVTDTTISNLTNRVKTLTTSLRNSRRREKNAKRMLETACKRVREAETERAHLASRVEASRSRVETLERSHEKVTRKNRVLQARLARVPVRIEQARRRGASQGQEQSVNVPKPSLSLKSKGVVPDPSRDMVRNLVAVHNVPVAHVNGVVNAVVSAMNGEVEGTISERSIGRIMLEGEVAANIQIVDEVRQQSGVTLSSDGTTHKNINYGSHHITYSMPGETHGVTRFMGILHEVNHTSETQLNGWKELVTEMHNIYNECVGTESAVDARDFVEKVKGMLTDHAEDQKKLVRLFMAWKQSCEREVRGERAVATLPPHDIMLLTSKLTEKIISDAGGRETWEALPPAEQQKRSDEAIQKLHHEIGEQRFTLLSPAEKDSVDFFVWAGCCMHKELNAVKGGNKAMTAWWQENGVEGPILLMNRDNTAAVAEGISSAAAIHAVNVSGRGAVKVLDLTGQVFRHKNDKKGQQDSLRYYLEASLGYFLPWPDTSNTRYQSHCDGASAWLVYKPLYIPFLELVMDRKDSQSFTNIERNVYNAFGCLKTAEEMACFSTWGNCIGHPYMRQVRGQLREHSNLLELGPLHTALHDHLGRLISDIELAVGPEATYQTASLDGKPFERPDAFYIVQSMAQDGKTYPHIRPLLVAFLRGAAETFVRFTSEFVADGVISRASKSQRELARMETTNDANEGALGTLRVTLRRSPRMSLAQFNARLKYKKNGTGTYIKKYLGPMARHYLRQKARAMEKLGTERKCRIAQVQYDRELAEKHRADSNRKRKKREAAATKLAAVVPRTTNDEIEKMRVAEIDLQLRWHRTFDDQVPRAKDLMKKKKEEKVEELQRAVMRYNSGLARPGSKPGGVRDGADERKGARVGAGNEGTGVSDSEESEREE